MAWIALSIAAAALAAAASLEGVLGAAYVNETASWAAQGVGQDVANLAFAVPLLVAGAAFVRKGSERARSIWIGTLIYLTYSYALYSLFVHFGPLFIVYVATLGCSAYALAGALASTDCDGLSARYIDARWPRPAAVALMTVGVSCSTLWLNDIIQALVHGVAPSSAQQLGFAVNPVHVLDLALVLPAMIATSVLLWRRRPLGFLLAGPLLVFSAIMGVAIIAIAFVMNGRNAYVGP